MNTEPNRGLCARRKSLSLGKMNSKRLSFCRPFSEAFTLPEILVSLTIIGVIAVFVLSVLSKFYQEKTFLSQFQQTYSLLQQAYQGAVEEYGTADTWANTAAVYGNLKPYFKIIQDCPATCHTAYPAPPQNLVGGPTTFWLDYYHVMLANGATLRFVSGAGYRGVVVNINGNKGPNRIGYDVFTLHFTKKNNVAFVGWPYYTDAGTSWIEVNSFSCNKSSAATDGDSGVGCSYWIIKHGNMDYLDRDISGSEWVQ